MAVDALRASIDVRERHASPVDPRTRLPQRARPAGPDRRAGGGSPRQHSRRADRDLCGTKLRSPPTTGAQELADALKTLQLFDEKADELPSPRFFDQARGGGAILEFTRDAGWEAAHVGPDEESTRALVLTLRLFMQNNDRLSLHRMAGLYASLPQSARIEA